MLDMTTHEGEAIDIDTWGRLIMPNLTDEQVKAAWKCANKEQKGICWWKIGEGKTRIAIAWMFMISNQPRPLIICSPGAFRQWLDEIDLLRVSDLVKPKFVSVGKLSVRDTLMIDFKKYNCIVVDELWNFKNPKSNQISNDPPDNPAFACNRS